MNDEEPVIVLGAGGHTKVLIDVLNSLSVNILGITDNNPNLKNKSIFNIPIIGNDNEVLHYSTNKIKLVNGLGSTRSTAVREKLYKYFKKKGYSFSTLIHPSAIIAANVSLAEGAQVMAGAILQTNTIVGENSIINTGSSVDHDCFIGKHVHISPGVTICGCVQVDSGSHIGTGATIIQGIKIGSKSLIAAGSVVIRDVPSLATVIGVPAEVREK